MGAGDPAGRRYRSVNVKEMKVSRVYPLLVQKAQRKGRTQEETDQVITWLTGYTQEQLAECMDLSYEEFFARAPQYNPNAEKITGKVCGVQVETIEDPVMKRIRQLDKLIDELAKGRPMEKILRK